jgi:hypothetical protein
MRSKSGQKKLTFAAERVRLSQTAIEPDGETQMNYAASRAGMKRLRDSNHRRAINDGWRCETCEVFITVAFPEAGPALGCRRNCPKCAEKAQ